MEMEMIQEAWEAYGESDFLDFYFKNDLENPENPYKVYMGLCERENKYPFIESGGSVYFYKLTPNN